MRSETLEWVIGMLCALLGALVLVAPHRFAAPASPLSSGWGILWGPVAVLSGLALISVAVLRPRRSARAAAHALAGAALLTLAASFAADGIWVAAVAYVLLGVGTGVAGAVQPAPPGQRAPDVFALLMGTVAVLNGLVLLLFPELSRSSYFDQARGALPALGTWLLLGGALLFFAQLGRGVPGVLGRSAHLVAGGAFLAFGAVVSLPRQAWTAVAVNWTYGAVLAALPWISRRLSAGETSSLRARLALVMAGVTSVALIATVALATWQDERFARRVVAADRAEEAVAVAMRLGASATLRAARADGVFSPVEAEIIADQIARPGLNVWLLGEDGGVLASATQEGWPELPPLLRRELSERAATPADEDRLLGAARVPDRRWTVVAEGDRDRELAGSRRARDVGLVLLLLFLPFTITAGTLLAARVARPLTVLEGAVTAMAEGDPGPPLERSHVTEVARLAATFATLRDRLAERTAEGERLAAELRARAEALSESDRRKDEFLAMLGHELRNPLGAISTSTAVMAELAGGDARLGRAIAITRRQVSHLSRLVDDLLDVSRITRGAVTLRRELVDLRDVLASAVEATREHFAAKDQRLEVARPEEPLLVLADPTRLEQVATNLLRNATKYTPHGGHVLAAASADGADALLLVRDDGVGIAPELLPRVFDMFFQADQGLERAAGGLGIGLTLVRRLVELHGGRCEARSAGPGEGTEVEVRLPLAASEAGAAAEGAAVRAMGSSL